jgi:hypothetical protein
MSYDLYLRTDPCPHCGARKSYDGNLPEPTYNLTPIFDLALTNEALPNQDTNEAAVVLLGVPTDRPRGLRILSGRLARETRRQIMAAVDSLFDERRESDFRSLEPPNKWGTLESARDVMKALLAAASDFPDGRWEIR